VGVILPVAVYCLVVYPLLFTGTAKLKPNSAELGCRRRLQRFCCGSARGIGISRSHSITLLSANSDDQRLSNTWRAILVSALLFSVPHALNLLAGHAEARVLAQVVGRFSSASCSPVADRCRSIWPVAVLHGAMNAFVHVNRLGIEIQPSLLRAAALASPQCHCASIARFYCISSDGSQ